MSLGKWVWNLLVRWAPGRAALLRELQEMKPIVPIEKTRLMIGQTCPLCSKSALLEHRLRLLAMADASRPEAEALEAMVRACQWVEAARVRFWNPEEDTIE